MTITVTSEDGSGVVSVDRRGQETTTIGLVEDLRSEMARKNSAVLSVSAGQSVTITAGLPTTREVLAALRPDAESEEDFEVELDDLGDRIHEFEAMGSVQINGEAWGWLKDDHGWKLLPQGDGSEIASMSAWMSASMTGASLTAGIRAWPNDTVMVWFDDDESNPEGDSVEIKYAVDDWGELAVRLCSFLAAWYDAPCPFCEDGWEIDGSFDERFSSTTIGRVLSLTWKPCEEHLTEIDGDDVGY